MELTALAYNLNRMRETRIIVWLQAESEGEAFNDILKKIGELHFVNLLLCRAAPVGLLKVYRLLPFPFPRFEPVYIVDVGPYCHKSWSNYGGITARTLPDQIMPGIYVVTDRRTGEHRLSGSSGKFITAFTKGRNISLKYTQPVEFGKVILPNIIENMTRHGELDIPLSVKFRAISRPRHGIESSEVIGVVDWIVIVPCRQLLNIHGVYNMLLEEHWAYYILGAYVAFAIIETLISTAEYYLCHHTHRFDCCGLFVNLRVFCGLLGFGMPIQSSGGVATRQVIMTICVFGLVFSTFFSAKLSTLLTMFPQSSAINTFEDLEAAQISVILDPLTHERKPALYFANGLPYAFFLPENSIYKTAIDDYIRTCESMGFFDKWRKESFIELMYHSKQSRINAKIPTNDFQPLRFRDLNWLCYAADSLAFVVEYCVGHWQKRSSTNAVVLA
ncbi:uncharacterized protein LOC115628615 [Scaptodrosophila lebanonensis]|uniref:Uncharacterized protein LOC115628615 n=1 Tax=Drosophila lebanonensis TaxID=7225 RepID=A0A6J2TX03_DROLE|nr:uncharacterized protein LOC115628615 [Scaptodrosophila lebanonensis]